MTDMNVGLRNLHGLLSKLGEVREELARGPRQVKAREALMQKAEAELASKREALKQAKASADRKALDLKTNEGKIAGLRAKLNAASSNKEFDIIKGQIEADTVANSVLEDEILEALETVDRMQIAVGEAEQQVTQTREERDKRAKEVAAAEAGLKSQISELEVKVNDAEKILSGDAAANYRRLVDAYGADALAAVDGTICTNCYVAITPQMRVGLNSGKVIFCNCSRLLFVPEGK
ncbi:MAG: hypothetical protein KDA52_14380 [Planctomycetaceae bacterium]|nr:hypothetical protein [Planctomycetaceae bacterium]